MSSYTSDKPTETKQRLKTISAKLKKHFPVFRKPMPLKIGIKKDILEHRNFKKLEIHKKDVVLFLTHYTRYMSYLKSFRENDSRYDLHGKPVESLTEAHKENAKQDLIKCKKFFEFKNYAKKKPIKKTNTKLKVKPRLSSINQHPKRKILSLKSNERN